MAKTKRLRSILWLLPPLFLLFSCLWWGLPANARLEYLFENRQQHQQCITALAADTRRLLSEKDTVMIPEKSSPGQELDFAGKQKARRRYLLFSQNPDEMRTLAALAAMAPRRLNFNPKEYTYGSGYYYAVGATLKICQLLGLIELVPSSLHYYRSPSRMGRLYVAGRAFNLVAIIILFAATLSTARLLGFTGKQAYAVAAMIGVAPGILIWGSVMKPHLIATALGVWGIRQSLPLWRGERPIYHFLTAIAWVALAGSCQYTAVLLALLPMAALCSCWRHRAVSNKTALGLVISAVVIAAAIFFALNPYHLFHLELVRKDLAHTAAFWQLQPGNPWLLGVGLYQLAIAGGPGLWLTAAILISWGICPRLRRQQSGYPPGFWPTLLIIVLLWLLAAANVACRGFDANNARFFVLITPAVILLGLRPLAISNKLLFSVGIAFLLAGIYIALQHIAASSSERPHYQVAKWLQQHLPPGATLAVSEDWAPFRYPPLTMSRYRLLRLRDLRQLPANTWLLTRYPLPASADRLQIRWSSRFCYFRASYAEEHLWIYCY